MPDLIIRNRTLSQFHGEDIYLSSLFHGIGIFLLSFSISMALGVTFGLMCSLGLKHSNLALYPHIESCIVALVAYTSYFFSNGLSMSGEQRRYSGARGNRADCSSTRYRLPAILRNYAQALRVSHHVDENSANDQIHVRSDFPVVGELHLHLSRTQLVYPRCSSLQAAFHLGYRCTSRLGKPKIQTKSSRPYRLQSWHLDTPRSFPFPN
jgi:hypothetical protein